jgi:hypothetical protein
MSDKALDRIAAVTRGEPIRITGVTMNLADFEGFLEELFRVERVTRGKWRISRKDWGELGAPWLIGDVTAREVGDKLSVALWQDEMLAASEQQHDWRPWAAERIEDLLRREGALPVIEPSAKAAQRNKPGNPGLTRPEIVGRLVMVLKAEEIERDDPEMRQPELVRQIGWTAGSTLASKIKLFQDMRQKLCRYRESGDPDGILQEAQERFEKEKKKT